ncbi:DUF4430 domain-containing protein [Candidatus Dojkabacteria bacterium]|nr:DUF4430 domain-containing protein [Candidatus Dojkabacteria bacterium]
MFSMQNQNARKLALLAAALVILAAISGSIFYLTQSSDSSGDNDSDTQQEQQEGATDVLTVDVEVDSLTSQSTYEASVQEGATAFDVLTNLAETTDFRFAYDEFDFGVMITSMVGTEPSDNQFWKFQINGEDASVGISDYQIKEGDSLKFVLDEIQF